MRSLRCEFDATPRKIMSKTDNLDYTPKMVQMVFGPHAQAGVAGRHLVS